MWVKVFEANNEMSLINLDDTFVISLTKDRENSKKVDNFYISVQSNKNPDLEYIFGYGVSVLKLEDAMNQLWKILKEKKDFAEITIR